MVMVTKELLEQALAETREHGQARCLQTRDGRATRIYALDGSGQYPVHGAALREGGMLLSEWAADGRDVLGCESPLDLVPVPRRGVLWVNVYACGAFTTWHSRRDADAANAAAEKHGAKLLACVRREWREGRFDE